MNCSERLILFAHSARMCNLRYLWLSNNKLHDLPVDEASLEALN
jgi:hypothetical protein